MIVTFFFKQQSDRPLHALGDKQQEVDTTPNHYKVPQRANESAADDDRPPKLEPPPTLTKKPGDDAFIKGVLSAPPM